MLNARQPGIPAGCGGKRMKVKIEIDAALLEEEVIIRCRQIDDAILKLQAAVMDSDTGGRCIALRQGETLVFTPLGDILFFETQDKAVHAHTRDKLFDTEYKLYELEEILPGYFMRISKSTIVNLNHIYSVTRNLTSSSAVEFTGSTKKVYVSRTLYKALIERLGEKRRKI